MSIARINFSHGDHEWHLSAIQNIRIASNEVNKICAIMGDTKGPEIRTGRLEFGEVKISVGQKFVFTTDKSVIGNDSVVSVSYQHLARDVKIGELILVDDGFLMFKVESKTETEIMTTALYNGVLGERKGVGVPGLVRDLPSLSESDIDDILFCCENNIDFLAVSRVQKAQDILDIANLQCVKDSQLKLVAKIESQLGLDNFAQILEVSDGIVIARGELGIDIPLEYMCIAQKKMIRDCNIAGKPVIALSQMLESMVKNPRPTRAEVSDVANAIFDGVDCVTLSSETARGKYPIDAISMMRKICKETEKVLSYRNIYTSLRNFQTEQGEWSKFSTITDSIASSAVKTCWDLKGTLIISLTSSGKSALTLSKYRTHAPILCVTTDPKVARSCVIGRSIIPIYIPGTDSNDRRVAIAMEWAKERGLIKQGEVVVVVAGKIEGVSGSTNFIKVNITD